MDFRLTPEPLELKRTARRFAHANMIVPAAGFRKLREAFDLERCGNAAMVLAPVTGVTVDLASRARHRGQCGPEDGWQWVFARVPDGATPARRLRLGCCRWSGRYPETQYCERGGGTPLRPASLTHA